jgi:hypothetical protein
MAAVWGQGADLIVRYGLSSSALRDPAGAMVTLNGVLGRPGLPDRLDLPVRLPGPGGGWRPGRLVLVRRPAASAAKSRARIERKARKRGGAATPKQRRAADWLALLTTLDAASHPIERVMALYRLRWQVELAFRRLKGQVRLADLQVKDPRLARACLLAKLILALLADRLVAEHRRPFRLGLALARRPPCGAWSGSPCSACSPPCSAPAVPPRGAPSGAASSACSPSRREGATRNGTTSPRS